MDWSGVYDFPPASNNPPPLRSAPATEQSSRGLPDVTTRLHHLRNLLNSERRHGNEERRRALNVLDRELLEASADPVSERIHRRRRALESQTEEHDVSSSPDPDTIPVGHISSPIRLRRTATRPSERLERHRQRLNQTLNHPRVDSDRNAPSDASLLADFPDQPVPRIGSPDITTQEYSGEAQVNMDNRWRAKRRKLDADDLPSGPEAARYGYRGQVVSGPLTMYMVSCDGGRYSEPSGASSWPGNVLRNDSSVYCTKGDRCNIVLGHQKGIPFSLRKLVIKAPKNGFDAPIQEGMIFVSSDDKHLVSRTARYQIQYSPAPPTRSRQHEFSQIRLQPSHEYFNSTRAPLRSIDRSSYLQNPFAPPRQSEQSTGTQTATDPDANHWHEGNNAPRPVPGFQVTTRSDDLDSVTEDVPEVRPALNLSDSEANLAVEEEEDEDGDDDDDDDDDDAPDGFLSLLGGDPSTLSPEEQRMVISEFRRGRARLTEWRHQLRRVPSRIEIAPDPDGLNGSSKAPEVLAPHARFFIRRHKSCVSVRFDPPVAGKFILVKLWARSPDSNIDIQSIIAHGFAGPRYFPDLEFQ